MKRRKLQFSIVGLLVLAAAFTVHAANLQVGDEDLTVNGSPVLTAAANGGLTGEIVSASAEIPGAGSGTVYTTPVDGEFVLTQICISVPEGYPLITGSTMGQIAHHTNKAAEHCTYFQPGLRIPQNEALSMSDDPSTAGPTIVTITGVYSPPEM